MTHISLVVNRTLSVITISPFQPRVADPRTCTATLVGFLSIVPVHPHPAAKVIFSTLRPIILLLCVPILLLLRVPSLSFRTVIARGSTSSSSVSNHLEQLVLYQGRKCQNHESMPCARLAVHEEDVNTTPNPRICRTPARVIFSRLAQDLSHRVRNRCVLQKQSLCTSSTACRTRLRCCFLHT